MNKLTAIMLCATQCLGVAASAESENEVLVAVSRTDKSVVPGASLRRSADYALQRVKVSSDAPEANARKEDILATLRLLQSAAVRDRTIEVCILLDARVVAPLKIDAATVKFPAGNRAQTSEVMIAIKTKAATTASDASALMAKLKQFPLTVSPAGRAAIDVIGDAELTIENPTQYRAKLIELYAADARAVTAALGPEYRVVTRGIDRQLQWLRDGLADVVIFIPYEYDVIPVNVSSYSRSP
jgi:hypothetical protein